MRVIVRVLLLVIVAAILISAMAPAAMSATLPSIKTASIWGYVKTQHGKPVSGAAVGLYTSDPPYTDYNLTYTDSNGYYSMTIILQGGSVTGTLAAGGGDAGSAMIYPFIVYADYTYHQDITIQSMVYYMETDLLKASIVADGSDTASIQVSCTDKFGDEPSASVNKIVFTVTNNDYDGSVDGVFAGSYQKTYTVMGTTADVTYGQIMPATGLSSVEISAVSYCNLEDLAREWNYIEIRRASVYINIDKDTPTPVPTVNPTPSSSASPSVTVSPTAGPSSRATSPPIVSQSPTAGPSMAPSASPDGATPSPTIQESVSVSTGPSPGPSGQNPNDDDSNILYILGGAVVALLVVVAVMGGYIYGKGKK
jgi:hypothetical protein